MTYVTNIVSAQSSFLAIIPIAPFINYLFMDAVRQEILRQLNSDLSDQLEFAVVCESKVYPKDRKDLEERIMR